MLIIFTVSVPSSAAPKVAIVLGGGAARGFSHIGLLQALEEHGIPIDLLVGTSIGSIISSLYASGYSTDNLHQIVSLLNTGDLVELNIPPKGGLIDSDRLQHYLDLLLEHKTFNRLDIPFYSVITNLRTGEEVALNEGLVSIGVQASMSIPGLFPPVAIGENYYIDGGLKNAVPANVAHELGADVIIAVDITRDLANVNYKNPLTNVELAFLLLVDGYVENNTKIAHVLISPEVMYTSYMHFEQVDYLIEQGYKAGLAHIKEIKEAILAQDPNFEFAPYIKAGYSPEHVQELTEKAAQSASNLPRPLTLTPKINLDPLDQFSRLAVSIGHGPLSSFSFGYAYGLDKEMGGHELFLHWTKRNEGKLGAFVRKPRENSLLWGAFSEINLNRNFQLGAAYLSTGPVAWQLSSTNKKILESNFVTLNLRSKLTKIRDPQKNLTISTAPIVQVHPFTRPFRLWEIGLIYPYLYGMVEMSTPLATWQKELAYELGLGNKFQLFGLYPFEMSVGVQTKADQTPSLKLRLVGGTF